MTIRTSATDRQEFCRLPEGFANVVDSSSKTGFMFDISIGNVGIGTTSPEALLNVNGGIRSGTAAGGYHGDFQQVSNDTTITANGDVDFRAGSTNNGSGNLVFKTALGTAAGGTNSNVERMRITAAGNVGIGTTAPNSALEVNGSVRTNRRDAKWTGAVAHGTASASLYAISFPGNPTASPNNLVSAVTYSNSATNGDSWTINTSGLYSLTFNYSNASTQLSWLSRNSAATTDYGSETSSTLLVWKNHIVGYNEDSLTWTGYLDAGDVIRLKFNIRGSTWYLPSVTTMQIIQLMESR